MIRVYACFNTLVILTRTFSLLERRFKRSCFNLYCFINFYKLFTSSCLWRSEVWKKYLFVVSGHYSLSSKIRRLRPPGVAKFVTIHIYALVLKSKTYLVLGYFTLLTCCLVIILKFEIELRRYVHYCCSFFDRSAPHSRFDKLLVQHSLRWAGLIVQAVIFSIIQKICSKKFLQTLVGLLGLMFCVNFRGGFFEGLR